MARRRKSDPLDDAVTIIQSFKVTRDNEGIAGYLTGAAYALKQVRKHGPPPTRGGKDERKRLGDVLTIGPAGKWLAGFYFNDAVHRIAAAGERLCKADNDLDKGDFPCRHDFAATYGSGGDQVRSVRREADRLKHDKNGITGGRNVRSQHASETLLIIAQAAKRVWRAKGRKHGT